VDWLELRRFLEERGYPSKVRVQGSNLCGEAVVAGFRKEVDSLGPDNP
jgi:hypothetical protein